MNQPMHENVTPHSIEAEQAVLGAILRFNDCFDRIGDLQAKHFYRDDHRAIFAEVVQMISRGQTADTMTVWAALQARGGANVDGLGAYLNQIAQSVPSAANVARTRRVTCSSRWPLMLRASPLKLASALPQHISLGLPDKADPWEQQL